MSNFTVLGNESTAIFPTAVETNTTFSTVAINPTVGESNITFPSVDLSTSLTTTTLTSTSVLMTTAAGAGQATYAVGAIDSLSAFRIFICVVGSLANLVVIIAIVGSLEFTKTVTSWYILQLAIADLVFLLTIPLKVIEDQYDAWTYSEGMCKALQSILFINYYASITFLTVMAIDRYIAICHSFSDRLRKLRKKRVAYIVTVFVWVLCILLSLPVILYTNVQGTNPTCKCQLIFPKPLLTAEEKCLKEKFTPATMHICLNFFKFTDDKLCQDKAKAGDVGARRPIIPRPTTTTTPLDESQVIHSNCQYISASPGFRTFLYYNFIGMFIVPFVIVCACYTFIIIYVRKTQFRGDSGGDKKSASARNRNRIVIMCATLVVVFVLCWLPYHAQHLAKMEGIAGRSTEFCTDLATGTTILIYLNSAINPFLYSLITHCRTKVRQVKETRAGLALVSLFTKNTSVENSRNSRANSSSYVGARKESSTFKPESTIASS